MLLKCGLLLLCPEMSLMLSGNMSDVKLSLHFLVTQWVSVCVAHLGTHQFCMYVF